MTQATLSSRETYFRYATFLVSFVLQPAGNSHAYAFQAGQVDTAKQLNYIYRSGALPLQWLLKITL